MGNMKLLVQELSAKVLRFPHKHVIQTHHFILQCVDCRVSKNIFADDKYLPTLIYIKFKKFTMRFLGYILKNMNLSVKNKHE